VSELLDALRDELIAAGLARKPSIAGATPPLWLEPRDGVPAPGEGDNPAAVGDPLVLAAFLTGGIPRQAYAKMLRRDIVDIWLRARTFPDITTAEAAITAQLIDKRNWTMGTSLKIIECEQWRPLQPLERDEHGFTFTVSYWFESYA
jgi:hypothetical protein